MRIKIGDNRGIELLDKKKNPDAKHIQIGNYYGELTEDIKLTKGKPILSFSKAGRKYYIREKFDEFTNVINFRVLRDDYFSLESCTPPTILESYVVLSEFTILLADRVEITLTTDIKVDESIKFVELIFIFGEQRIKFTLSKRSTPFGTDEFYYYKAGTQPEGQLLQSLLKQQNYKNVQVSIKKI